MSETKFDLKKITDFFRNFKTSGYSFPIKSIAAALVVVTVISIFNVASAGTVPITEADAAEETPIFFSSEPEPEKRDLSNVPIDILIAAGEIETPEDAAETVVTSFEPNLTPIEQADWTLVNEAPKKAQAQGQGQNQGQGYGQSIDSSGIAPQTPVYQNKRGSIGWINIPGTSINNAVMQANNNDYYLYRTETGAYNAYGCYFADYENTFGTRSQLSGNTIIYGHHIDTGVGDNPNNIKFGQLFKYKDYGFASTHPYIYFSTSQEKMTWQVFAVFYVDLTKDRQVNIVRNVNVGSLANFGINRSLFNFNVPVSSNDKILTLYTCSYRDGTYRSGRSANIRFIVMAKLI
ncbi:MAG: class B sortase [Oscillospiraceae bacterium]|nr:class B sortase [Oscillospiraceae bacterium]